MSKLCVPCGSDMQNTYRSLTFSHKGKSVTVENVRGWHCAKCDEFYPDDNGRYSDACAALMRQPNTANTIKGASVSGEYNAQPIDWLRFLAWLNLIAGIIVAIYVGSEISIIWGSLFVVEAVFGCVFLLVLSSMAENLIAIRKNTDKG